MAAGLEQAIERVHPRANPTRFDACHGRLGDARALGELALTDRGSMSSLAQES